MTAWQIGFVQLGEVLWFLIFCGFIINSCVKGYYTGFTSSRILDRNIALNLLSTFNGVLLCAAWILSIITAGLRGKHPRTFIYNQYKILSIISLLSIAMAVLLKYYNFRDWLFGAIWNWYCISGIVSLLIRIPLSCCFNRHSCRIFNRQKPLQSQVLIEKNRLDKEVSMIRAVYTYNLWGMPFVSPDVVTRKPKEWSNFLNRSLQQDFHSSDETNELTLVCCQEAWAFRCGILFPLIRLMGWIEGHCLPDGVPEGCLSKYLGPAVGLPVSGSTPSLVLQILLLFTGWTAPWLIWDPKELLPASFRKGKHGIKYVVGTGGESMSPFTVLDSGLVILSNLKPLHWGFVPFSDRRSELEVNKGILWSFYKQPNSESACIAITTHMTVGSTALLPSDSPTPAGVDKAQILDIVRVVKDLKNEFFNQADKLEVVIAGDFNRSHDDADFLEKMNDAGFVKLSQDASTTFNPFEDRKQNFILDHVFHLNVSQNESRTASTNTSVEEKNETSTNIDPTEWVSKISPEPRWGRMGGQDGSEHLSDHAMVTVLFPTGV